MKGDEEGLAMAEGGSSEAAAAGGGAGGEGEGKYAQAVAMKFRVSSRPKRPASRSATENGNQNGAEGAEIEYVTAIDEQGVVSTSSKSNDEVKVIPKLEDTWQPHKWMKNLILDSEDWVFVETLIAGPKEGFQYGLCVRERQADGGSEMDGLASARSGSKMIENDSEMTENNTKMTENDSRRRKNDSKMIEHGEERPSLAEIEKRRFKEDMMLLPDEALLDAYEQMPIEQFGEALLRGMGWKKGMPIGRNSKVAVAPVEFVRRSGMQGLGATPLPQAENPKKYIKPTESR
ncbi:hypothetical protein O6H91_02G031900 [Diphasiastrum complanatum]|uniref:Uncharacterized protein n=1 Tax=Diphasiastrum complanatum TaxID=34168 RepID=A0ACC2EE37_DIPCM|nr:hypothetical protein O6H91_02G031900 [Diphasiastrum complanatum]